MGEDKDRRQIDGTAVFAIVILVIATTTMIAPLIFGASIFGIEGQAGLERLMASFKSSPFAPLEVAGAVAVLSLTGFPILLLIGGAAAIFGSFEGFLYSWIGSLIGAVIGFWIGRVSGGSLIRRYGGKTVRRASELLGRRGIAASALVRIVPSGPAIMVNMIAGASHMRFWQFLIGTALGSIPKTAFYAFIGGHLAAFMRGRDPLELVLAGTALLATFVLGWWVRRRFLGPQGASRATDTTAVPPAEGPQPGETGSVP